MAANVEGADLRHYAGLLDSGLVDVVSICTPPVAHEEPAVMALERGIHVMLEKPMAHTVESGRRILEAAEKSGAVLTIGFRHRFLPAIQKLRELVQDGTLGPVVLYQNAFTGPAFQMKDRWFSKKAISGGGTLMDTSIHSVDIFRFIVGEIAEQRALTAHHLEGTDVEDASMLLVSRKWRHRLPERFLGGWGRQSFVKSSARTGGPVRLHRGRPGPVAPSGREGVGDHRGAA